MLKDIATRFDSPGLLPHYPENLTTGACDKGIVAYITNARANENNRKATAMIRSLRDQGATFQAIADQLN